MGKYHVLSDAWFKKLFGNEEDKSLLCKYVNAICKLDIKPEYTDFTPQEIKGVNGERGIRFDVRFVEVENEKYTHVNLEAQTTTPSERTFNNRKFLYASTLFKEAFKEGDDYGKKVYSRTIFFMYYDKNLIGNPIKKTGFYEYYDKKFHDQIEIYEIYIENLLQEDFNSLNEYGKMISEITRILVDPASLKEDKPTNNDIVKDVRKMVENMPKSEWDILMADSARQFEQEMQEVNQMYVEQGAKQNLEDNIKKLSKVLSEKEIADILELDLDYVKEVLS